MQQITGFDCAAGHNLGMRDSEQAAEQTIAPATAHYPSA